MREERGQIKGNVAIADAVDLLGNIAGDVTIVNGGKVYIRGSIFGNLIVDDGGRVHIFGNISGNVTVNEGAKVIHSGLVGGDMINNGGRLHVEACARCLGWIRKKSGETHVEPHAQVKTRT